MRPPKAIVAGSDAGATEKPPAVSVCLMVIRKRADFLLAARSKRVVMPGFVLQARRRADAENGSVIRVGYTCSKKVGNSVARNRAKRRLREIANKVLPDHGKASMDYVLIGRAKATAERNFLLLQKDLHRALDIIHGKQL